MKYHNICKVLLVLLVSCTPRTPLPFEIGEVVRHKTGTQEMVVIRCDCRWSVCTWMTPDGKQTDRFCSLELESVK